MYVVKHDTKDKFRWQSENEKVKIKNEHKYQLKRICKIIGNVWNLQEQQRWEVAFLLDGVLVDSWLKQK